MTNGLALLALWRVCQKLHQVSSVQFSYVALYAPLDFAETYFLRSSILHNALLDRGYSARKVPIQHQMRCTDRQNIDRPTDSTDILRQATINIQKLLLLSFPFTAIFQITAAACAQQVCCRPMHAAAHRALPPCL